MTTKKDKGTKEYLEMVKYGNYRYNDALKDVEKIFNSFIEVEWNGLFSKYLDGDINFKELVEKRIELCDLYRNKLQKLKNSQETKSDTGLSSKKTNSSPDDFKEEK
jgi:hypothetical protein